MLPPNRQLKKLWEIVLEMSSGFACNKNYERLWWYVHLRTHNISIDWTLNFDLIVEIDPKKVDIKKNYIQKWDILFNNTNSKELVWKTALVDKNYPYAYSNHITKFQLKEGCSPKYIVFFLNYLWGRGYFQEKCNKWIWQAWFNNSMLKEIQIPLPPLEEQKKIVAYLDALNATISKLKSEYQSQLAMLDEMRNSSLDLAFWGSRERERERAYNLNNWKWVKLREVVTLWPKKSQITSISDDLKISFVPMADLSQEKMLFETKEVRTLGEVRKGYTYFEDRDVLLAKVTPCFENGKCGVARDLKNGIWFWSSEFFVFRMSESILPEYFYYFVSGKWFRKEWAKNMGWAVGLQRVKQEWIKNVEIPLPDLETQSQIVSHLDQVHQQITTLKVQVSEQIEHCDELWQSSLEKVLTQGVNNEFN